MWRTYNWFLAGMVIVCAGCNSGTDQAQPLPSAAPSKSVIRLAFIGTDRLKADTNALPWLTMSELPASQALWRQTLEKLAKAPYQLFHQPIASQGNDHSAVIRSLLEDSLRAESFIEIAGDGQQTTEYEIALRLPADRADFWRTNLLAILEDWTGVRGETLPAEIDGWTLRMPGESGVFQFVRSGAWTLFGYGREELIIQAQYRQNIQQSGHPAPALSNYWLEVFLDGPNLPLNHEFVRSGGGFSVIQSVLAGPGQRPAVDLRLKGIAQNLRVDGTLSYREPLSWKPEPWQIPTNLIRDPIIGFAAVQGFDSILKHLPQVIARYPDPMPGQLFVWSGATIPFQTFAAAPMKGAEIKLHYIAPQLVARVNPTLQAHNAGRLAFATNSAGLAALRWTGIPPFVTPFISTAQAAGTDFMVAGLHPNWGGTNPPPPDALFQQVAGRTNLAFYAWEITAERAWAWRNTVNVFRHIFEMPRLGTNAASIVWINSISNRLGNTVTEITQADAKRLNLVRHGPVGLTGLELVGLAHWLESPEFPLNGWKLAQHTNASVLKRQNPPLR